MMVMVTYIAPRMLICMHNWGSSLHLPPHRRSSIHRHLHLHALEEPRAARLPSSAAARSVGPAVSRPKPGSARRASLAAAARPSLCAAMVTRRRPLAAALVRLCPLLCPPGRQDGAQSAVAPARVPARHHRLRGTPALRPRVGPCATQAAGASVLESCHSARPADQAWPPSERRCRQASFRGRSLWCRHQTAAH